LKCVWRWGFVTFLTATLAVYLAITSIYIPLQPFALEYAMGAPIAVALLSFLVFAASEPICS